jgi:hypothetical protein
MFAYLDGEFMRKGVEFLKQGGNPKQLGASGVRPDLGQAWRGALGLRRALRLRPLLLAQAAQHARPRWRRCSA